MFGMRSRNGHDKSAAKPPIAGDTRFATTFEGDMALRQHNQAGGKGKQTQKPAQEQANERAMVNAGKNGAGDHNSVGRGLKAEIAERGAGVKGFFGEIRTNAGKVKFRTGPHPSQAEAAAAAFRDGPTWARECVTYALMQSHKRAA